MNIKVHNISHTSATVSWSMDYPCPENYYHVMYRHNWNSVFAGYLHQNVHYEERDLHSSSSLVLHRLIPSTLYILCVMCKNSYPSSQHCTTFHTLKKHSPLFGGSKQESTTSMWVVGGLLLFCFVALLLYGFLQLWSWKCLQQHRKQDTAQEEAPNRQTSFPERSQSSELKEELLEVPMIPTTFRDSGLTTESSYIPSQCFFPHKAADDRRAILPHWHMKSSRKCSKVEMSNYLLFMSVEQLT
uniref:Fibronectin type-III domain-containing protein n=1 Tax=Varanus komodoensis TaxID=61221 RepID=A0A8D2LH18_VARKO